LPFGAAGGIIIDMNPSPAESFRDTSPFFGERYRWLVVAVYAVVATVCAGMAWLEISQAERHINDVARERGAVLFRLIELTRDWNGGHEGGVYVPVTEATQPNPYLIDAKRDIVSTDGMKLTKVNPALMTRQIGEMAEKKEGVRMHITSLNPIRPANKADAWEAESLALFATGVKERISFFGEGAKPVHRYMAPLLVKPECMTCHAQQRYEVGQVRGGISVTMPAGELLAVAAKQTAWTLSLAIGTCLVVSLLGHLALDRARRYYVGLSDLTRQQDRIIAERTREVETRNADLQREVDERARSQQRLAESEARYRSVIESSQDGVVVLDQGNIVFANERMSDLLGFRSDELIGGSFVDLVAESDRAWVAARHQRRMRGEAVPGGGRVRLRHHNPKLTRIADKLVVPLHEGRHDQWVVTLKDVTTLVRNERELLIADAVFDHAAEGVMVTDAENRILRVNPAFTSITGYTPGEVVGKNPAILKSGRHDAAFYDAMWQTLAERGHWEGEIWNRHKSGSCYLESLAITTVSEEGGESGKYVATFIDITERKRAEELLRHKAHHDPLTDLPNRALFHDRLDGALAASRRYGRQLGLLAIDLDFFKGVNDSLGHQAGDELLVEVAKRLLSCVRQADTVARLGGDEFAVLLTEVGGATEVEQVANRALQLLAQPFRLAAGTANISGSIGMVLYPEHGEDAETLRHFADRALYAVKASGRNGCRFYAEGP
jgi:diguanylate cyclase (GGDEF)-like protein/PAS domain S-box-containing protein